MAIFGLVPRIHQRMHIDSLTGNKFMHVYERLCLAKLPIYTVPVDRKKKKLIINLKKKKSETELTASVLLKDPKYTRD